MARSRWNVFVSICSIVFSTAVVYVFDNFVHSEMAKMAEPDQQSTSTVKVSPQSDDLFKSMIDGMPGTAPFTEESYHVLLTDTEELNNSSGLIRGGIYSEDGICNNNTSITSRVLIWEKDKKIYFVNASTPDTSDEYTVDPKVDNLLVRLRVIPVRSMRRFNKEARVGYTNGLVFTDKDSSWTGYSACGLDSIKLTLSLYKDEIQ